MKEGEEETKEDDEGRRDGITYVVERREERVKGEGILLLRQSVWSRLLLFDATMYLGELSNSPTSGQAVAYAIVPLDKRFQSFTLVRANAPKNCHIRCSFIFLKTML